MTVSNDEIRRTGYAAAKRLNELARTLGAGAASQNSSGIRAHADLFHEMLNIARQNTRDMLRFNRENGTSSPAFEKATQEYLRNIETLEKQVEAELKQNPLRTPPTITRMITPEPGGEVRPGRPVPRTPLRRFIIYPAVDLMEATAAATRESRQEESNRVGNNFSKFMMGAAEGYLKIADVIRANDFTGTFELGENLGKSTNTISAKVLAGEQVTGAEWLKLAGEAGETAITVIPGGTLAKAGVKGAKAASTVGKVLHKVAKHTEVDISGGKISGAIKAGKGKVGVEVDYRDGETKGFAGVKAGKLELKAATDGEISGKLGKVEVSAGDGKLSATVGKNVKGKLSVADNGEITGGTTGRGGKETTFFKLNGIPDAEVVTKGADSKAPNAKVANGKAGTKAPPDNANPPPVPPVQIAQDGPGALRLNGQDGPLDDELLRLSGIGGQPPIPLDTLDLDPPPAPVTPIPPVPNPLSENDVLNLPLPGGNGIPRPTFAGLNFTAPQPLSIPVTPAQPHVMDGAAPVGRRYYSEHTAVGPDTYLPCLQIFNWPECGTNVDYYINLSNANYPNGIVHVEGAGNDTRFIVRPEQANGNTIQFIAHGSLNNPRPAPPGQRGTVVLELNAQQAQPENVTLRHNVTRPGVAGTVTAIDVRSGDTTHTTYVPTGTPIGIYARNREGVMAYHTLPDYMRSNAIGTTLGKVGKGSGTKVDLPQTKVTTKAGEVPENKITKAGSAPTTISLADRGVAPIAASTGINKAAMVPDYTMTLIPANVNKAVTLTNLQSRSENKVYARRNQQITVNPDYPTNMVVRDGRRYTSHTIDLRNLDDAATQNTTARLVINTGDNITEEQLLHNVEVNMTTQFAGYSAVTVCNSAGDACRFYVPTGTNAVIPVTNREGNVVHVPIATFAQTQTAMLAARRVAVNTKAAPVHSPEADNSQTSPQLAQSDPPIVNLVAALANVNKQGVLAEIAALGLEINKSGTKIAGSTKTGQTMDVKIQTVGIANKENDRTV